jgi:hypothetical protein
VGIRYGFDLDEKRLVVEIVCEIGEIQLHNKYKDFEVKSHGLKEVDSDGGIWEINGGDIVVAVGGKIHMKDKKINEYIYTLSSVSLSVKTREGIKTEFLEYVKAGNTLSVISNDRKVICSLGKIGLSKSSLHITEEVYK